MRDLLGQIRTGLEANLYYLSLFVTLCVPSMCGAMDSEDGRDNGKRYIAWFNKYVAYKYNSKYLSEQ